MHIALDAMGGDLAPVVTIEGAQRALRKDQSIQKLFLVGDKPSLEEQMHRLSFKDSRAEIVHAPEVVAMHESGAKALRSKKSSSISVATELVKKGIADAVVSAGNTGAAVAAATVKLRNLKGVERAGIASGLPSKKGICQILDAGANPDAKPRHMVTYAVMGAVYAHHVLGIDTPTVGILSNGEEEGKGTTFTKEAFSLIEHLASTRRAPFHFVGNIEGQDLFAGELDVALCDGFTGNLVLKACEATAKAVAGWLKEELTSNPLRLLGAFLAKGGLKALKQRGSAERVGGSPLLGVKGVCIIAHGSSSSLAIQNAILTAKEAINHRVNPHIEQALIDIHDPSKKK